LTIDLLPYIEELCTYQDGYCDTDCPARMDPDCCYDYDEDGYGFPGNILCAHEEEDCDDNKAHVNPGANELCGTIDDDNCDGQINEGCGSGSPLLMKKAMVQMITRIPE